MARQRGYAICTQPRSGSNLLCQYLASTDQLGYPLEYFNGPGRRALGQADFPDAPELQIDAILRTGATPNGVYAVKLFASQFSAFSRRLRWLELLPDLHFVYLSRDDLLGQAISWVRALQTEQYRSTQPAKRFPLYDPGLIRSRLIAIVKERAQWEAFFARTGITPFRIVYERFFGGSIERRGSDRRSCGGRKPGCRSKKNRSGYSTRRDHRRMEAAISGRDRRPQRAGWPAPSSAVVRQQIRRPSQSFPGPAKPVSVIAWLAIFGLTQRPRQNFRNWENVVAVR